MDYDKLIEQLKKSADFEDYPVVASFAAIIEKKCLREAATALSTLQAENEKLRADLRRLQTERDTLWAANQHLLEEREQLTAERDAAVSDVSDILAEVEEIRRGYGVDNADADAAFADLCGNYCAKCGNNCYEEAENYRCKNYEWRGMKED